MGHPPRVSDAIVVDEIGLELGRYQDFILRTAYQPIFRSAGDFLRPFAVEGFVMPFREGRRVPVSDLFRRWRPGDEVFIERMCRLLHLRNYRNVGAEGVKLLFGFDPQVDGAFSTILMEIDALVRRIDETSLVKEDLICVIAQTGNQDRGKLAGIAAEIRQNGMALAIDDFGIAEAAPERVETLRPEIVKIDGKWFRQLCAAPETTRLFNPLVAGLQGMGAKVLVSGIDTAAQLGTCVDAGVDYLQGHFLAAPQLAGTIMDERPRAIAGFLKGSTSVAPVEGNVVRLFGR
jgi:EAL domain-containing protein (putative c-di-GMP-specific phosphodiesterase class I)